MPNEDVAGAQRAGMPTGMAVGLVATGIVGVVVFALTLTGWPALAFSLICLIAAVAAAWRMRRHRPVTSGALIASVVTGAAAMELVLQSFSAGVDAADYGTPFPAWAQFGGAALILFAGCVIVAGICAVRLLTVTQ